MVAFAAVAANAAKVKWGVSDGSFEKISTGTMYLVWAQTADFSGLAAMEKFDAATIASVGGKVVDSKSYAGGAQTQFTVVKPTTPISDMGSGPKNLYTMIVSADGKAFAYSAVASTPILNNENTSDIAKAAADFTVADAKGPGPEPIPEPTSAMLLVLGVAGLALRRRA